jgi:hypothetical protein
MIIRSSANARTRLHDSLGYKLYFGISKEVLDLIDKWDIESLLQYEGLEFIDEANRIS